MRHTRRGVLRKASALGVLAIGTSTTASAHCSAPEWDPDATYTGGDEVVHDGALWTAEWWTRREPDESLSVWTREHACDAENQEPTASFTTDVSAPSPGQAVTFDASGSSDPEGSIASYEWDIDGDGSVEVSGESVTHTYESAGDYDVTLIVTDDAGAPGTVAKTITVSDGADNAAPNASFTVDPADPATGDTVSFDAAGSSDSDGSISSSEWTFGDGTTTTGASVTHSYDAAEAYTVTLTVTDDQGASDSNATTVSVAEDGGGGGGGGNCDGVSAWESGATYTGGDQVVYDGALWTAEWWTRSEPAEGANVWTREGECGSGGGGGGGGNETPTASVTTDVSAPNPGQEVTFDASASSDPDGSISSYAWDFGDGSSAIGEMATHTYGSAGDYTATVSVTDDAGATDTASVTVSVSESATQITLDSDLDGWIGVTPTEIEGETNPTIDLVSGETYAFTWNNADGIPHDLTIHNAAGAILLQTETVAQNGQSRTLEFEATEEMVEYICTIHPQSMVGDLAIDGNLPPTASFAISPANPDPGGEASFDASGSSDPDGSIASYAWEFGDGTTGTGQTPSHTYTDAGTYTVELTVTDNGGASAVATNEITVGDPNQAPTASFTASPSSPDTGQSVSFDAAGSSDPDGSIASYSWDFGDDSSATGETASHAYAGAGSFTIELTVTDDAGATGSTTSTVQVGGGTNITAETTLEEFYAEYDQDFYPKYADGGVAGLLKSDLPDDASENGVGVQAIKNNAGDGSLQLGALGDRGLSLVQRFDADGVARSTNGRLMPWLTTLPEQTEPIPFNSGKGRTGGLTADAGPELATNDPSVFVQDAWPKRDQFDDVYTQPQRTDWSGGVSQSQYTNTDNPIIEATTDKIHPVTGESLGSGFTSNAPLDATAELHGDGWLFEMSLIFKNTTDVPLLIDGSIMWWVGPEKGGQGLDQFNYDNAQRRNYSVGHPQRDVIEVTLPKAAKPGPFEGTDAPLSAYGIRVAHHDNPYMYRTLYPNQKYSMTYQNVTGPGQYDWPVEDVADVMLDTCHVEFREDMASLDQNTELVDAIDMRNRYGN